MCISSFDKALWESSRAAFWTRYFASTIVQLRDLKGDITIDLNDYTGSPSQERSPILLIYWLPFKKPTPISWQTSITENIKLEERAKDVPRPILAAEFKKHG